MTSTLGGTDLGYVATEDNGKNANLFVQAIPITDSDRALVLDLFGVTRTINISGVVTGSTATLQAFITAMEAKIAANQSAITFVSSIHASSKSVRINNFRFTYGAGTPNILTYTLELIEGS